MNASDELFEEGRILAQKLSAIYAAAEAELLRSLDDAQIYDEAIRKRARQCLFTIFRDRFNRESREYFAKQVHDAATATVQ